MHAAVLLASDVKQLRDTLDVVSVEIYRFIYTWLQNLYCSPRGTEDYNVPKLHRDSKKEHYTLVHIFAKY